MVREMKWNNGQDRQPKSAARQGRSIKSRAHESSDGVGGFFHPEVCVFAAALGGVNDAVLEVIVQQTEGHSLRRAGQCAHLRQNVDAVLIVFNHPLDSTNLPFDAPKPVQVVVFVGDVAVRLCVQARCFRFGWHIRHYCFLCDRRLSISRQWQHPWHGFAGMTLWSRLLAIVLQNRLV